MLRIVLSVALCLSVIGAAGAKDPEFAGRWGLNKKSCQAKGPSEGRMTVSAREIAFYETTCKVEQLTAGKVPGVWYVLSKCKGEGETWQRRDLFVLRGAGGRLAVVSKDGYAASYVRCK